MGEPRAGVAFLESLIGRAREIGDAASIIIGEDAIRGSLGVSGFTKAGTITLSLHSSGGESEGGVER